MKKLQIFDLDDTILRIPTFSAITPVESIDKYSGDPYRFYDARESLDYGKYNIQLIQPVYEEYLNSKGWSHQVLITHRVEELNSQVSFILDAVDMQFDEKYLLGRKGHKADVVNEILAKFPQVEEVEIFEDSVDQIISYKEKIKLRPNQSLTFWFVDKSKIFKLGTISITESKRIKLKTV